MLAWGVFHVYRIGGGVHIRDTQGYYLSDWQL